MAGWSRRSRSRRFACFACPRGAASEEGAALLLTYATTITRCSIAGICAKGCNLLVLGAAGGVGLAAVELGKAFGARVIAAVSSEEKAAAAEAAGADEALVYGRAPFDRDQSKALAEQFKTALGPQGADVIVRSGGRRLCRAGAARDRLGGALSRGRLPAGIPGLPLLEPGPC